MSLFQREITFEVTLAAYPTAGSEGQEINIRLQDFIDGANVVQAEGERVRAVRVGARPWVKLTAAAEPVPGGNRTGNEEVFGPAPV